MKVKYILLIILVLIYFYYTFRLQLKINSNILLSKKQKVLNSILIWIIPYIWYHIVKDLITPDDRIMTKRKRNKLIKKKSGGFYESGKGITG